MALDAVGLLDALSIRRVHVVGRSMGGFGRQVAAAALASDRRARLSTIRAPTLVVHGTEDASRERAAWSAGRKVGMKRPLTQKQIWAVRFFLDRERRTRDRALFDLAIDSKLRGCDLVKIRIRDVVAGPEIRTRAIVIQQKTGRPVQFESTSDVRTSLLAWLERRGGSVEDHVFPSRIDHAQHMSTRQYARLVDEWVTAIGLRLEE